MNSKSTVGDEEKDSHAKEEARKRTLTDFRIVGLEFKALGWKWGVTRDEEETVENDDEEGEGGSESEEENDVKAEGNAVEKDEERSVILPDVGIEVKVSADAKATEQVSQLETSEQIESNKPRDPPQDPTSLTEQAASVEIQNDEINPSEEEENPVDASSSAQNMEQGQDGLTTDIPPDLTLTQSSNQVGVEGKRGEKRKAKMSSPDAGLSPLSLSSSRISIIVSSYLVSFVPFFLACLRSSASRVVPFSFSLS